MIIARGQARAEPETTFEVETDPIRIERLRIANESARRNNAWIGEHWDDFLPQAYGKILAVADQEGFVADTPEEAWAWVHTAHPRDEGALVQYVRPAMGPRVDVHQG